MQKRNIALGIIVAAVVWGGGLAPVAAQTSTSSVSALIIQLEQQIADLKAKIEAVRLTQTGVSQAAQNVGSTLKLLKQLREGMSGDDVKLLQSILAVDPSIFPEGKITGFFGRLTSDAVKRFQRKHGLESIGNVGPKTLARLNEFLNEHPLEVEDDDDDNDGDGDRREKRPCAKIPPGHMIAPGWLRKMDGIRPIVPECQKLPRGIEGKIDDEDGKRGHKGSSTPDRIPPVMTNVNANGIGSTTATISWTTAHEPSTSKVYYGTTTPLILGSTLTATQGGKATSHSVPLSGLSTSTSYYYVVESKDAAGNTATSSQNSLTTLAL